MADEQRPEEVQRWTAKRRAALVLSLLRSETTAAEAARRHGLKVAEVEDWRDRFLLGAEKARRARPKEDEALREEELNRFKRKVGELTIDLDILRTADRLRPMAVMAIAASPRCCASTAGGLSQTGAAHLAA
jgi:transposase-like protein